MKYSVFNAIRPFVICIYFSCISGHCFAQKVVLKGKVVDDSNNPIELAQVFVE